MATFFLKRLSSYREFPESAALAAKCIRLLTLLATQSGGNCDEFYSQYKVLPPLLKEALGHGEKYNALLEKEVTLLSKTMGTRL